VIAFAGLSGFENVDVGRYSSGMRLRLSMAMALYSKAAVIFLDDVLGVGDISFQQQCVDRLLHLKQEGRTMLLVLSDDGLIRQLADRSIELHAGQIVADGPPEWLLAKDQVESTRQFEWHKSHLLPENDVIALENIDVHLVPGHANTNQLELDIEWRIKVAHVRARPALDVMRGSVLIYRSLAPQYAEYDRPQTSRYKVLLPLQDLPQGNYTIGINVSADFYENTYSLKSRNAIRLTVDDASAPGDSNDSMVPVGYLAPTLAWDYEILQGAAAQEIAVDA
jgi:hypothetical protein